MTICSALEFFPASYWGSALRLLVVLIASTLKFLDDVVGDLFCAVGLRDAIRTLLVLEGSLL